MCVQLRKSVSLAKQAGSSKRCVAGVKQNAKQVEAVRNVPDILMGVDANRRCIVRKAGD